MLSERQIRLVVISAMSKYSSENDGRKGLAKKDIVSAVAQYGGDIGDVRCAMIEGIQQVAPDRKIIFS